MSADTNPGKGGSEKVVKITKAENRESLQKKGLPPELAEFGPGADWLLEHGGMITGHVEENGDIVIDKHEPKG